MERLAIGLDIGTSSIKGCLVDADGRVLVVSQVPQQLLGGPSGWQEQDPVGGWYNGVKRVVSDLQGSVSTPQQKVVCLGVTGFVPGMCLLDASDTVVRNAILHTDTRAEDELALISAAYPGVHQGHLLPKLVWVANHEPSVFAQVAKVVVPHAYVVGRMTGRYVCDYDTATAYGAVFDTETLNWDSSICEKFGLPPEMFVQAVPATAVVGTMLPEVAQEFGLDPSVRIIAGTGDSFATLLGSGVREAGSLMLYWGTSGTRVYTWTAPATYVEGPYFQEGRAEFVGRFFSCGESMNHMASLVSRGLGELDILAERVPPRSGGVIFLPHGKQQRSGSGMDTSDHLLGLRLDHGPGHVHRAVLESIAYASLSVLDDLRDLKEIRICGGAANSTVLRTIVASLSPVPLLDARKTSAARGIALLAFLGIGESRDRQSLVDAWSATSGCTVVSPDRDVAPVYREAMKEYEHVRNSVYSL